jgi:hypothetical protein
MKTKSWVILFAVAGCNSLSGMSEDEFCKEYAKRECARVADLCSFMPSVCEPVRVTACRAMAASSKTGVRKFNPDNAQGCLDQVNTAYANVPIDAAHLAALDKACARVFEGNAAATEACTVDFDCTKNLVCDKGRCGTARVVGSGGGCANFGEVCPAGEYCSNATGFYLCTRRQAQGAACGAGQPCVEDLRCNGTCGPRLDSGATCAADDECKSAYCNAYPPAGSTRKCGAGLNFSEGSASCQAFMDPAATPPAADAGAQD